MVFQEQDCPCFPLDEYGKFLLDFGEKRIFESALTMMCSLPVCTLLACEHGFYNQYLAEDHPIFIAMKQE